MGQRGHCQSRGLYNFYGKGNENHQLQTGIFYTTEKYQGE